jgi:hypothetical protein
MGGGGLAFARALANPVRAAKIAKVPPPPGGGLPSARFHDHDRPPMQGRADSERIRVRHRARRHGGVGCVWLVAGAIALGFAAQAEAEAAPVRGTGQAKASETKSPSVSETRARALRRARRAALEAALRQVAGPVDPSARKAVLDSADAWTGAYRVLSEQSDGQSVDIEVEVEVDLVRLTKRVAKRAAVDSRPLFRLGQVGATEGCGEAEALAAVVRAELSGQGGVALAAAEGDPPSKSKKQDVAPALDVALDCRALGPVQHMLLHAVRVRVTATAEGRTITEVSTPAFAATPAEALTAGIQRALTDASAQLVARRHGHVRVRVQSPLPAVRLRRLETAMRNSLLGVDEVALGAVGKGVVELHVRGELSAKALARGLGELSLPGFSLSVVAVEPPDVVTIRLQP